MKYMNISTVLFSIGFMKLNLTTKASSDPRTAKISSKAALDGIEAQCFLLKCLGLKLVLILITEMCALVVNTTPEIHGSNPVIGKF